MNRMDDNIRRAVVVYCGSSAGVDTRYVRAAYEVGLEAARRGLDTVTGAGSNGLMGAVVDGTLAGGGDAIGVIPQFMVERGWANGRVSRMIVTADMHERKRTMAELSAGAIALPGGVGTLDELMEIVTWRQLGIYGHPVVLVNVAGYYDPLLSMFDRAEECGMLRNVPQQRLWHVAESAAAALDIIEERL